jgi:replicative DNA helicase
MLNDFEAEQAILGSCLTSNSALNTVLSSKIIPEWFYDEKHQHIFRAIRKAQKSDIVLIKTALENAGHLKDVTLHYLTALMDSALPSTVNEHIRRVNERYVARFVHELCVNTTSDLESGTFSNVAIDSLETELMVVSDNRTTKPEAYDDLKFEAYKHLDEIESGMSPGIMSGIEKLDELTAGFHGGELIIIAARPGHGKSAFALNTSMRANEPVLFFSLEMQKKSLATRIIVSSSKVNAHRARSGNLNRKDWIALNSALSNEYQIYIDDGTNLNISEIRAKSKRFINSKKIKMIVVDYIQLLASGKKHESRRVEVGFLSRSLKRLALELDIPVVVLSQLNRANTTRNDKTPQLSDLRESGDLEQDADVVMFIHQDWMYNYDRKDEEKTNEDIAEIIVAKQRNGALGKFDVEWDGSTMTFNNRDFDYGK